MRKVLRIFFQAEGTQPGLVLFCLLLGALAQGVGLASMLPVVSLALEGDQTTPSGATKIVADFLNWAGIPNDIYILLAFAVCAIIVKNILTLLAMVYVGYAVAHISTHMRRRFVDRLMLVKWSYLSTQPLGEITNALSLDATRAGQAYFSAASFLVYSAQAMIYIILALFVSWKVTLLSLIAGAGIAFLMGYFVRRARFAGRRQTRFTSEFVTDLSDALNNIKPLKAMDRQGNVAFLLERSIKGLRKALRRQVISKQALKNINEALAAIVMGLGLAGAIGIWNIGSAELVVLAVLLVQLVSAINKIQGDYQKAVILESAYYSVEDKIADIDAQRERANDLPAPSFERGCRLEKVSFAHPGRPVLKGVTLDFPRNETIVLTGPSGAGKTTVADLLLGFNTPDEGRVLIDDTPLDSVSLTGWRRMIGYVPQELILFNESIFDNISLGDPQFDEAAVREAMRLAGGLEFIDGLADGLQTQVGEKGAKLSGGQRQRIALARALVTKPKILILDEVTSALDPATEAEIVDNIRALQGHTTIIAITHRAALLDLADHVYALKDGQLRETTALPDRDVV